MRVVSTRVLPVPAPGQHQHRAVERLDRLALLGVEAAQIGRRPRRARAPRCRRGRVCPASVERIARQSLAPCNFSCALKMALQRWRWNKPLRLRGFTFAGHRDLASRRPPARGSFAWAAFILRETCAMTSGGKRRGLLRRHVDMQRHVLRSRRNPAFGRRGTAARNSACAWHRNRAAGR